MISQFAVEKNNCDHIRGLQLIFLFSKALPHCFRPFNCIRRLLLIPTTPSRTQMSHNLRNKLQVKIHFFEVSREIVWLLPQKQTFWSPAVLYDNSYNLGWWRHSRGVLSRRHRAYVLNSKSICELLTLYCYNNYF